MKKTNYIPCSAAVSILLVAQKPRFIVAARNMFFTVQLQNNRREIWGEKKLEMFFLTAILKCLKNTFGFVSSFFCGFIWSNQVAHTSAEEAKSTPLYSDFF